MDSDKKTARIAGLLYLVVVLTGIFNLAYVPGKLIVWQDADATVKNILGHETLFRLGIVSGLICYSAFLLLPLALYKLLKPVHAVGAVLMVALAVVSVPVSLVNLGNKFAVLSLLSNAAYLKVVEPAQLQAQVMFYLHCYSNGNQIAQLFWGLWLLPFGYLVFKSGLLPKVLGVFLMLGCFGYLVDFVGSFLFKGYSQLSFADYVTLPASIGEIGTCLWLLIAGVKSKTPATL